MKKVISIFICCIILTATLMPITAFAWETPELKLNISYNEKKQEITVEYRIDEFAGTESADFVLRYDSDVVEYIDHENIKLPDTLIEVENVTKDERVAITFATLYYIKPEDCDEDGGKNLATIRFRVKDVTATEAVFIATSTSCAMDPDSQNVSPARYTEKVMLKGSEAASDDSGSIDSASMTKVYIAAAIAFVVLAGGTIAVVVKYRKK